MEFSYNAAGQHTSGRTPSQRASGGARDSVAYDAAGNLAGVRTPLGHWTRYHKDALGRDTLILSPTDGTGQLRQVIRYDAMGRDTFSVTGDSAVEAVVVRKQYNAEGALEAHWRRSVPDRNTIGWIKESWRFDAAGRNWSHKSPNASFAQTTFDPAGNPVSVQTRRVYTITMEYDGLNRLIKRVVPPADKYQRSNFDRFGRRWDFPRLPLGRGADSLRVPGDTVTFVYDAEGNLREATIGVP